MAEFSHFSFRLTSQGKTKTVVATANPMTIGRVADNTLVIADDLVSSHHLQLKFNGQQWEVTDLDSTNGTQLGDITLKAGLATEWLPAVDLRIGNTLIQLQPQGGNLASEAPLLAAARRLFAQMSTLAHQRMAAPAWLMLLMLLITLLLIGVLLTRFWTNVEKTELPRLTSVPTFTPTVPAANAPNTVVVTATATPTPVIITPAARPPAPGSKPTSTPAPVSRRPVANIGAGNAALAPMRPSAGVADNGLAVQAASLDQPLIWDARLTQLGVTLQTAQVSRGQAYWRLTEAHWADEQQAAGTHHIYVEVLDENGQRITGQAVTVTWGDGGYTGHVEAKPPPEYGFNYMMYAAGYAYRIQVDGLPSDSVQGMGLGNLEQRFYGIHVSYYLTYQKTFQF